MFTRQWCSRRSLLLQVDFLFDAFEQVCGREPTSFVELGCGPAQHSLEMAESGLRVIAVDTSAAMLEYAQHLADSDNVDVVLLNQDMRSLQLPVRFVLVG
jgi:SAM-dependent methyltransferase